MDAQAARPTCLPDPLVEAGAVLKVQQVQEMLARQARGESGRQIAEALGVDRKTVRSWLRRGTWQPRRPRRPISTRSRASTVPSSRARWIRAW